MITATIYETRNLLGRKQYRFRIQARNSEIIASGEAYNSRRDAIDTLRLLFGDTPVRFYDGTHVEELR